MSALVRLILFISLALALALGATWLADRPGHIMIDWEGWRIETSAAAAFVLTLALGVVVAGVILTVRALRPKAIIARKARFDKDRGLDALTHSMIAIAAGDATAAEKQAGKARRLLSNAPASLMISAQAAELKGDRAEARKYFKTMLEDPETEFLGLRGMVNEAMAQGDHNKARAMVRRARELKPRAPWVLDAAFVLESQAGEWKDAERALSDQRRKGLRDKPQSNRARAVLLAAQAADEDASGLKEQALENALAAFKLSPDLPENAALAARLLGEKGKIRRARSIIENAMAAQAHPVLVEADRKLEPTEAPTARMRRMERLAARADYADETLLGLGEAALRADKWGRVKDILLAVPEEDRTQGFWQLEADVYRAEGRVDASRAALGQLADAPKDPQWHCRSCGRVSSDWSAVCPACNSFDSQKWNDGHRTRHALPAGKTGLFPARSKPAQARPAPLGPTDFGDTPKRPTGKGSVTESANMAILDTVPAHMPTPDDEDTYKHESKDPESVARQTP